MYPTTDSSSGSFDFTPTQDWFSHNITHWKTLIPLVQSDAPRVLEIGSWEGRSAVFLLENLCKDTGEIVCVDHFDLFATDAGKQRFSRIQHNLALTKKKYRIIDQFSVPALMTLLEEEMELINAGFDWVYVDGSHEADDTFLDGELAWRLARKDALIIFDDYHWETEPEDSIHHPKRGVDAFLKLHEGQFDRLTDPSHYQVVIRKTIDMRIGFLHNGSKTSDDTAQNRAQSFGYGINVALTVDSAYAIGAAVTLRSVVEHTPGRITFYIVDCGLSDEDCDKLTATIPVRDNVTMKFLQLPSGSLTSELGGVFSKLEIHDILPIERVLYLDSDILVRESIEELWSTDLRGSVIAAAPDVGHPMGHQGIERGPYFNAGVLLMDLAKVRSRGDVLKSLGRTMKDAKYRDQDALNLHFKDQWLALGLKWNAQGLGTYAKSPSLDRDDLDLSEMNEPKIVHFTGPVYPSLVEVLNPYVQPVTSKPWGYAGARGHPFRDEWVDMLNRTAWKGRLSSDDWKAVNLAEVEKALKDAERQFREQVAGLTGGI